MDNKFKTSPKEQNRLLVIGEDLRLPLMGILGYAGLIAEETAVPDHRQMASEIEKAVRDLLLMADNMRKVASLEAGGELPDYRWIPDLKEELEETLKGFYLEARSRLVRLEIDVPEPINRVYWDFENLRQHVFNNLISGAIRFTPPGGMVRLGARVSGTKVILTVEDTGPGIPEELWDKIFKPGAFSDGESRGRHRRQQNGYGFGLYTARLFVENHGGKIYLDRSGPALHGEDGNPAGVRFVIELPEFPG